MLIFLTFFRELHFGTRIQVQHKLEVYYTWCGREFCYKTRQKVFPGGAIEVSQQFKLHRKFQKLETSLITLVMS